MPVNTPLGGFRGIGIAGGIDNVVENNTVEDSARYGIAVFSTVDAESTWSPDENLIASNEVWGSGVADLALAAGSGESNCFERNQHATALPTLLNGGCDAIPAGSQEVADDLVLPPPELAERDPTLEQAPSYTGVEPPNTQALSSAPQSERVVPPWSRWVPWPWSPARPFSGSDSPDGVPPPCWYRAGSFWEGVYGDGHVADPT